MVEWKALFEELVGVYVYVEERMIPWEAFVQ